MPNHIGAFLKASKSFSALGINITRVSYNKAVDSHTLFIDAEGTEEQLKKADIELEKIGYSGPYMIEMWYSPGTDDMAEISKAVEWLNSQYERMIQNVRAT